MGIFHTVSEIDGDFSRKLQNFPTPRVFCLMLMEFHLELGIGAGIRKTGMVGLPDGPKSFKIDLAI